jgi:hypothetical protein
MQNMENEVFEVVLIDRLNQTNGPDIIALLQYCEECYTKNLTLIAVLVVCM